MKFKPRRDRLAEVLGVEGRQAQVKAAEELKALSTAPVLTLCVQVDTRTGSVALGAIGPSVPVDAAYRMLDAARDILRQREKAALAEQQAGQPEGAA